MPSPARPNLFKHATSELSQDAFICWLAEWADPKYKDSDLALHQAGQAFVASLISKHSLYDPTRIKTIDVRRQADKLDVLLEINKDKVDKLAVLIEDKTHTSNHSDQLNRYYKAINDTHKYESDQIIPILLKTGYQSRFVIPHTYRTYLRKDLLDVLQAGKDQGVTNAIYDDFFARIENLDILIRQFSTKPASNWEYHDWVGFFTILYDQRSVLSSSIEDDGANWGYVANPSGGFVGYWWYFKQLADKKFAPYLQLEEEKLCFKIMVDNESDRGPARDEAHQHVLESAKRLSVAAERPKRMGSGKYMTVACFKDDYRVFSDQKLDLEATLANIVKAQEVIKAAFLTA